MADVKTGKATRRHVDVNALVVTDNVPAGASELVLEVWGGSGSGGNGATGSGDHQGAGGSAPGYAKSVFALVSGDWGKTISLVVGAIGAASSTSGSALNAGSVAITANGGATGTNATGTTNGAAVTGGTATGGNTTNTTGASSTAGNSAGTAGQGAAANNGWGVGGQGGYSVSNTGKTNGVNGRVKFTWT